MNNNIRKSRGKAGKPACVFALILSTLKLVPFTTTRGPVVGNNDDRGRNIDFLLPFRNPLQEIVTDLSFSSPKPP
jgi:hypothetical protein